MGLKDPEWITRQLVRLAIALCVLVALIWSCLADPADAATVDSYSAGYIRSTGGVCVEIPFSGIGNFEPEVPCRSWFVFMLPSEWAGQVTAVDLELSIDAYFGTDPVETLFVTDSDPRNLNFTDLGSGETYAFFDVTPPDVGSNLIIPLSSLAVADVNALAGQDIAIGVRCLTVGGVPDETGQECVRFGRVPPSIGEYRLHVTLPEPPDSLAMLVGVLALLGLAHMTERYRP